MPVCHSPLIAVHGTQDISNTLWALATLRHHPGKELMAAAARQAVLTAQQFKPQEVANTLWSFAILGHHPSPQMLDAMAMQLVTRIQLTRPQVRNPPCSCGFWEAWPWCRLWV